MTPERRQELRRWSAELMGWVWSQEYSAWVLDSERDTDGRLTNCYPDQLPIFDIGDEAGPVWEQLPWHPDLDSAPAWQILGVIERMRELGWRLYTSTPAFMEEGNSAARFAEIMANYKGTDWINAATLPEAVLEAAWATGVGR